MTKKEAAIVSAFTGFLIGSFADMHKYAETKFGRPIFTHEFGSKEVSGQLKKAAKPDFISIPVD